MSVLPVVARPLFFLDYDGTLAPIVDDPKEAHPHQQAPEVLEALAEQHPLWIVTGRHLRDLALFLPGLPLRAVGLHGLQEGEVGGAVEDLIGGEAAAALARLREGVPAGDEVWVEDKEHTFAVHYRAAEDKEAARRRLRAWLESRPDFLEEIWGKDVLELRPKGFSKGVAVRRIAAEYPDRTPLYLGDDVTDEDAFRALGDRAVTIKVGPGETAARYRLADPDAVVAYLRRYL